MKILGKVSALTKTTQEGQIPDGGRFPEDMRQA